MSMTKITTIANMFGLSEAEALKTICGIKSVVIEIERENELLLKCGHYESQILKNPIDRKQDHLPIAEISAVYFLFRKKELIYIGQTGSLVERIIWHKQDKVFDSIALLKVSEEDRMIVEALNIDYHQPPLNKQLLTKDQIFAKVVKELYRDKEEAIVSSGTAKILHSIG